MRRVKDHDEEGKGPRDQEEPGDQGTRGPRDQSTRGPEDQGTKGSGEPEIGFPVYIYIYLFIFLYIYIFIFIFVPRVLDFFPGNLDFFPVLSPKQPQAHGLQRKITTIIAFPGACSPRSLLSDPISSSEWQPREQRQGLA